MSQHDQCGDKEKGLPGETVNFTRGDNPDFSHSAGVLECSVHEVKEDSSQSSFVNSVSSTPNRQWRKSRIAGLLGTHSKGTAVKLVSAVDTFERWLWMGYSHEKRRIEDITPRELDQYLADFFLNIKKPDGGDYNCETFRILRSNIDTFLKSQNYPVSIIKGEMFFQSQQCYIARRNMLRMT